MRLFAVAFSILVFSQVNAKNQDDCFCPEVKCQSACEIQDGVTFYTEKCANGSRVKSCARPTCIAMPEEDRTPACLSYLKNSGNRQVASEKTVVSKKSESNFIPLTSKIGKVTLVKGKAWLKSENGAQKDAKIGASVREADTIITSNNGRVAIAFDDGNILNVLPNSQTKLTKVSFAEKDKKTLIDLIKGKVRSRVQNKYKGANYFKVRTKSAVAGVRGTDFVVSYEVTGKAITKVQTLEGAVQLASGDEKQHQMVKAGQEGSFVVAANMNEVFSEDEISEFISRGYMTPVYKMTANEIKKLNWDTKVDYDEKVNRALAKSKSSDGHICSAPKGRLNQCLWQCRNNPDGEKKCRTDLPQVNCVRQRCNANGDWADDTRLPASYFDMCKPSGEVKVGPCDY